MTKTLNRFVALFAIALLALGLGFMAATPQKAHAAETKLAAGATFQLARDITPKTGGTVAKKDQYGINKGDFVVTQRNLATFNTDNENHYYKFTTSSRNSVYRITVSKETDDDRVMNVEIRNAKLQRFASASVTQDAGWTFQRKFDAGSGQINRNATYYIELSRYVPESQTGTDSRSPYVDYRITIEEIVPKPAAINADDWTFKLYTKSKKYVYNVTRRSFYADGYQVRHYIPRLGKWYTVNFSGTTVTFNNSQVKKSIERGNKQSDHAYLKYYANIRPYRVVNGIKFFGDWCDVFSKRDIGTYVTVNKKLKAYKKKSNGAYVKCTKNYSYYATSNGKYARCKKSFKATLNGDSVTFTKGQYYSISKYGIDTLSASNQEKYFKYSKGLKRYAPTYTKGQWVKYSNVKSLTNATKKKYFVYSSGKITRYKKVTYKKGKVLKYATAISLYSTSNKKYASVPLTKYLKCKSSGAIQRYEKAKKASIVNA